MTWWIVILLIGVALSPLAWLRSSPRQRRQIELRLAARRMGLAMQLAQQEWPHWLPFNPPAHCAQYHRARRAGRSEIWAYWQVSPGEWLNQWREPCADAGVLPHLSELPGDVYKVEAGRQMIALYWGEGGDQADLQKIANVLTELA